MHCGLLANAAVGPHRARATAAAAIVLRPAIIAPASKIMNEALVLPMRLSVTRARQLRIGCFWRTLIRLAHLVSKTDRPERTRRLLAVAESVCAKCLTLVEHDRNADRHGGYDHP